MYKHDRQFCCNCIFNLIIVYCMFYTGRWSLPDIQFQGPDNQTVGHKEVLNTRSSGRKFDLVNLVIIIRFFIFTGSQRSQIEVMLDRLFCVNKISRHVYSDQ